MRRNFFPVAVILAALVALVALVAPAAAQTAPPSPPPGVVLAPAAASLAVTTSSGSVALPNPTTTGAFVGVINDGAVEVFFDLGGASVVATTAGLPLPPGKCLSLAVGPNADVAAITFSGTSTIRIIQANGPVCPE